MSKKKPTVIKKSDYSTPMFAMMPGSQLIIEGVNFGNGNLIIRATDEIFEVIAGPNTMVLFLRQQ